MLSSPRRLLAAALFTVIIVALVNLAWWTFYSRTVELLDQQLSRRLVAVARTASVAITPDLNENMLYGDFDAYWQVLDILQQVRRGDSLAEVFILGDDYNYLATTASEEDSSYFLAALNGPWIDSVLFGMSPEGVATKSYPSGDLFLKSAFVPLLDHAGLVSAVLGVEASVDYFGVLADLKSNLHYSSLISIIGGILFGILFLLFQRRINRMEQQFFAAETNAYLGRMVRVVSHELKNPLMIIRASAERLLKKTSTEEAGFVIEEADRLNEIVTGYLDFAKAGESHPVTGSAQPYDLIALISDLRSHIEQKYDDQQIEWIESSIPEELTVTGYSRSTRQVLLNLMINAVEACLGADMPIKVGVEIKGSGISVKDGVAVEIKVLDRGPGLSKREMKNAFEPFYTTRQSGSGLGLYVSKIIVVRMGGQIEIHSRKGQPTEVIVKLPASAD